MVGETETRPVQATHVRHPTYHFQLQSHWDRLPHEIQTYIVRLRESQSLIEMRERESWRELCNEIRTFAKVQAKWGLGALKVKMEACKLKYCPQGMVQGTRKKLHMIVSGFYRDGQNVKREMFLGYSFNGAYYRIDDIKRLSLF